MKLENEFVVPVPRARAWDVLMDVERVAPCMPGATFDGYAGDSFKGRVKVKLGPITVTYSGVARFVERDGERGRAVIDAAGKEMRGTGTANAVIETVLVDQGDQTLVKVNTDLTITGKPAQFGRGVMVEVGTKIIGQFAECLASQLGSKPQMSAATGEPVQAVAGPGDPEHVLDLSDSARLAQPGAEPEPPAPPAPPEPRPAPMRPTANAIDLLDAASAPVRKRVLPPLGGLIGVIVLYRVLRRMLR